MTQEEIKMVLDEHGKWVADSDTGKRANLTGADFTGAGGLYIFGPMPTSKRICYAVWNTDKWMVKAGCFWGDLDQLEASVKEKHNCPIYLANIQLLRNWKYD